MPFQRRTEGGGLAAPYAGGGGALTCRFDVAEREGGSLQREEGGVSRRLNKEVEGGASLDGTRFIVLVLCRTKELSICRLRACLHNWSVIGYGVYPHK